MRIITRVPHQRELAKGIENLSALARHRLAIIKWYLDESKGYSTNSRKNALLTCRHFGIHSSYFHRWYSRYRNKGPKGLEDRSRRPRHLRSASYGMALVGKIREQRRENPTWAASKLRMVLLREMPENEVPSRATIGRIIKRFGMFYRAGMMRSRKLSAARMRQERKKKVRLPYNMRADRPCQVVEFDMKHINMPGVRLYAMCGIDQYTRRAVVHVSGGCSSKVAREALRKVVSRFGWGISVVNDNGSENKDKAEDWLAGSGITQYWARPTGLRTSRS